MEKRYEEALKAYDVALAYSPEEKGYLLAAAEIAAKNQQNPSRALPYMERAYKLYSSDIEVAEKLGINYAMLNNFEGAIQILEPLYQANPTNASIMRNLGIAYYNAGQTQMGLSLISQSDALNSKSTNP